MISSFLFLHWFNIKIICKQSAISDQQKPESILIEAHLS